ncbi:PepSY domain-containing protein [Psychrobacter sp. 2Y5]|uniref:PepSY domain-containing protein n=1 Tax=unclassified Psychrobacter TaxID=196806 RepID=UPI003F471506
MKKHFEKFKVTKLGSGLGSGLALALAIGAVSTVSYADINDEIRAAQATKITLKQAVDIANKQAKGILVDAEFDDDDSDSQSGGGVYELEFSDGATEYEIKVDAITGQVVELDTDSLDSGDVDDYNSQRRAKISVMGVINTIEKQANSRVLEVEFKNDRDYADHPSYFEVDMLRDNQIIELKIDAETGREFARKVKK